MTNNFIIPTNHEYPPHNKMIFEEYFYRYFIKNPVALNREYLPILWTNYYISKNYAQQDMSALDNFLKQLDRNKKYFTVVQWDDGILNDVSFLDLLVFGQGGGGKASNSPTYKGTIGQIAIPLNNMANPTINKERPRDVLASFVGALNDRHIVRDEMKKYLLAIKDFKIMNSVGYPIFKDLMERSVFSLCPRGYGATSFRINESLQFGAIPVYIYDTPWIPWVEEFDFNEIGILCPMDHIQNLHTILNSKTSSDIAQYQRRGQEIYKEYFEYEGCAKNIINKLISK